jgi:hypothetical protein
MTKRELKTFLCHGSEDKPVVRELYSQLRQDGVNPWLDETDILGGQNWDLEIRRAVRNSDVILVCLSSSSVGKEGYIQKEIRIALDIADEKPEGTIFIIPIRLDQCEMPERLKQWQRLEYYEKDWYEKLLRALRERAVSLNLEVLPGDGPIERIGKPVEEISGRLLYKSVHLRELLRRAKNGDLLPSDIEYVSPATIVGITFEAVEEALSPFSDKARREEEKELILRFIGIRDPFDFWQEHNSKTYCFQNKEEQPEGKLIIEHVHVDSSNISSIGYDSQRKVLEVRFHNGLTYQYFDVPTYLHQELMNASSHGKFLHRYIINGGYAYRKLDED